MLLTVFCVLSGQFSHSITDLVANKALRLGRKGLEEFLADDGGLVLCQRNEEVKTLASLILASLGSNPPEDNGGEGASRIVASSLDLFSKSHQKNLGTSGGPVVLQVLLGLGSVAVVGGLQS